MSHHTSFISSLENTFVPSIGGEIWSQSESIVFLRVRGILLGDALHLFSVGPARPLDSGWELDWEAHLSPEVLVHGILYALR